jgi:hypothetical protein
VYDYKDRQLSDIKIQNKNDMYLFGTYMYQNANIYLDRKYKIFFDFKKHYNLN